MLDEFVIRPGADIPCDNPGPAAGNTPADCHQGYGWTALTWQRPGEDWYRSREKFLDASSTTSDFDHAHAWASTMVDIDNDTTYIYYGGYEEGHKGFDDRKVGIAEIDRNRFIAKKDGTITTDKVQFNADQLYVNIDTVTEGGTFTVSLRNEANTSTLMTCTGITSVDSVRHPVTCPDPLSDYNDTTVRLRFATTDVFFYGFELADETGPLPTPTMTPSPTPGGPTPTATPQPDITDLGLNEINHNTIDVNGNGIVGEPIADQCIEIFNPNDVNLSMAGWSLWDNDEQIFIWKSGMIFGKQVLVVFGEQFGTIITGNRIDLKNTDGEIVDSIVPNYSSDILARLPNGVNNWQWLSGESNSTCGFNNPNP
jgi:hypothetical protein